MASLNKVQLIGNFGRDPELRYLPNGDAVVNVTLATSEAYKDRESGERKEVTEWHRLVAFKGVAEVIGQYLVQGSQVYVEGKLRTRKWTDKDGVDKYTTEIVVRELQMLGGKRKEGPGAPEPGSRHGGDLDDDIPF